MYNSITLLKSQESSHCTFAFYSPILEPSPVPPEDAMASGPNSVAITVPAESDHPTLAEARFTENVLREGHAVSLQGATATAVPLATPAPPRKPFAAAPLDGTRGKQG